LRATELGIASIKQRGHEVKVEFHAALPPTETFSKHLLALFHQRIHFCPGPQPGVTIDLAGARNQRILDLFERALWFKAQSALAGRD